MSVLDYLTSQGFTVSVEKNAGRLVVHPAHMLTDDLRRYITRHKPELLALLVANDSSPPAPRAVLNYRLHPTGGGTLIDPEGSATAVRTLWETYGQRLDWPDLLERFEERAAIMEHDGGLQRLEAEQEALRLIRACMKVNYPHENI